MKIRVIEVIIGMALMVIAVLMSLDANTLSQLFVIFGIALIGYAFLRRK